MGEREDDNPLHLPEPGERKLLQKRKRESKKKKKKIDLARAPLPHKNVTSSIIKQLLRPTFIGG